MEGLDFVGNFEWLIMFFICFEESDDGLELVDFGKRVILEFGEMVNVYLEVVIDIVC